ncbi:MAG: LLM class flavin-dependent oxidoreductase [Dehalococcoidia bacterium]
MKFGLFYEWPNPEMGDWKRLFDEGIEQIQYSEEMGFDFVLIAEHHFSNYGNSPAPLLQATYIAQATKRLQIATGILVLPIWQPLRLAEEVAVLDNLSDGRFICGVGRGYQPHELDRFGVSVEESRGRFEETLDVLIKAWTSDESFTYDGKYIQIPNETVVWPKPKQKPHPPLWVAGSSAETMEVAAERDMVPITASFRGPQGILDAAAVWARRRRELGKPVEDLELGVQALTLITDSEEEARANLERPRWQMRGNRSLGSSTVVNGLVSAVPYEGEPDDDAFLQVLYYGTPDSVVQKLQGMVDAGVTMVSMWTMLGGIEHEKVMKSIKLAGEEVLPALREARPPAALYEALADVPIRQGTLTSHGPVPS